MLKSDDPNIAKKLKKNLAEVAETQEMPAEF